MTRHISIDVETLGLGEAACILSIGAVEFDPTSNTLGRSYYAVVDIEAPNGGGTIDAAAVAWWMRQSQEARDAIFSPEQPKLPLIHALVGLSEFLGFTAALPDGETPDVVLWQRGDRDWLWLESAYKGMGLEPPVKFWQIRDQRTFCDLFKPFLPVRDEATKHHALGDATYQAQCICAVVTRLLSCSAIQPLQGVEPVGLVQDTSGVLYPAG